MIPRMETQRTNPPCWLAFGLSGWVGRAVMAGHVQGDPELLALSRLAQPAADRVTWLAGELASFADPDRPVAAVLSLGPLDVFARWFERSRLRPARVVAIGSTSVHCKADSPDAAERDLAARLHEAESRLSAAAADRGTALTLLRPTLIYGHPGDRSLSRLVGLARRFRWLPLPRGARGLRQPVHVEDLAATVLHCLRSPVACAGAYDLGGGEVLAYDEMVRRCLAAGAPGARLVRVPDGLFRAGVRVLRGGGVLGEAGEGVLARLDRDLVFDLEPARQALGYHPRPFRPVAAMFPG